MKNIDIVITGLQSWDIEIGSNCKNIALEFSKNNRVLFVNPPIDRLSALKNKLNTKKREHLIQVKENLWVYYPEHQIESISRLPIDFLFDLLNKRNNKIFAQDIQSAIRKLKIKDFIHFCDSDMFRSYYLKELFKPKAFVYYVRDNLLAVKYWQTQGLRIEPKLIAKSDLVVANSPYLAKLASKHNPNSHFVGQGCDLTAFKAENVKALPKDIADIPKPIVGYIGALKSLRLDIKVLEYLADSRPQWNIVLIGPEDEDFQKSDLHRKKNVRFLGRKDEKELPSYLSAFDVAINPQIFNDVTIGNYPRKIDEYLAMGKAVVATKTETMEYFKEHVLLANDQETWLKHIETGLGDNSAEKKEARKRFAQEHSWENNVNQIYENIEKIVSNDNQR